MNFNQKCWKLTDWLQMSRKEFLWTFLIVAVLGGAAANLIANFFSEWLKPSIPQQIRTLHQASPPFDVHFWLETQGKTVFNQSDRPTLFYKVTQFRKDIPLYLTVLNISPDNTINPLVSKKIQANQEYTLPEKLSATTDMIQSQRLTLNSVGKEYFKVLVTSEPIEWQAFLNKIQEKVQPVTLWATAELTVDVNPVPKTK